MNILTFIACLYCSFCFSQTRLISHKSHSGSSATFTAALENSLFDITESNFGEPGSEMRFVVDTVILLPDNRAVVIASEKDVWVTYPKSSVAVKAGRDTVNNAMLADRHNKDSLKNVFQQEGSWQPVLINYDNEKPMKAKKSENKKNIVPIGSINDNNFPGKPMLIFSLALLSGVLGFVSYYIYKVNNTTSAA